MIITKHPVLPVLVRMLSTGIAGTDYQLLHLKCVIGRLARIPCRKTATPLKASTSRSFIMYWYVSFGSESRGYGIEGKISSFSVKLLIWTDFNSSSLGQETLNESKTNNTDAFTI